MTQKFQDTALSEFGNVVFNNATDWYLKESEMSDNNYSNNFKFDKRISFNIILHTEVNKTRVSIN